MRDRHGDGSEADETGPPARVYANDLSVAFGLSEIELRFGQRFGADTAPAVFCWIVTSPVHLAAFSQVIGTALQRYQAEFGAIPDAGLPTSGGER